MAAMIQDAIQKLSHVSEMIQHGYTTSGVSAPAKKMSLFANKHFKLLLRIILFAYCTLAIYDLLYMKPLFPFETHPMMTMKTFFVVAFKLTTIGLGLYGEFMHSALCLRIFIIMVGVEGTSSLASVILVNPIGFTQFGSQRQIYERLFTGMRSYKWTRNELPVNAHPTKQQIEIEIITRDWDLLQFEGCCGIDGYDDWNRVRPITVLNPNQWPHSCCENQTAIIGGNLVCETKDVFKVGCRTFYGNLQTWRDRINLLVGIMEIIVAVLFYFHEQQNNPDHPSARLISDHNSLVELMNQAKNPQYHHNIMNANNDHHKEPKSYGSMHPEYDLSHHAVTLPPK